MIWTPSPLLQRTLDRGAFFFWPPCCCPGETLCYFGLEVGNVNWRSDEDGGLIFSAGSNARRLRTDSSGYLYMARGGSVAKWSPYDPTLFSSQLWSKTDGGTDVEVDQAGTVYTIEGDQVYTYDPDGNPVDNWTVDPPSWRGGTVIAWALAVDTDGNVAVLADVGGEAFLKLYDASGVEQWEAGDPEFAGMTAADTFDSQSELAFDAGGNVYFAIANGMHGACDASGSILWTQTDVTSAVVVAADGTPYYSVFNVGGSYVIARDPGAGTEISRCNLGNNRFSRGLAHSRGHLYVASNVLTSDPTARKTVFSGCSNAWGVQTGGSDARSCAAHPGRAPLFQ